MSVNRYSLTAEDMRREYQRGWRRKNADKIREYQKKWRQKNPEKTALYAARYWQKKADKMEQCIAECCRDVPE
jgi:hypothetical protein